MSKKKKGSEPKYKYKAHGCKTLNPVAHPAFFVYEVATGRVMFRSPHQSSCIEYIDYLNGLTEEQKRSVYRRDY